MSTSNSRNFGPIVGLSDFNRISGTATALGDGVWVPILEITNVQKTTRIASVQITFAGGTPTGPTYRFSAKRQEDDNYRVIAPHASEGQDIVDGQFDVFVHPIHIPKGGSYRVEVYATMAMGATAEVTALNLIEFTL